MTVVVDRMKDVRVDQLTPWERNPRRISEQRFQSLVRSMQEDPDMMRARPLIALRDGRVIAGNMRLRAAEVLGWLKVPTVYVDLDENRARLWALRDNNPYGEWDEDLLSELLYELQGDDVDLMLTGFGDEDIARLLADVSPEPDPRGLDLALADVSVGDPTHVVTHGEVWNVGPHLLAVHHVYDGWQHWVGLLEEDMLLVPYPTPTLPLTVRAARSRLLMVQPDAWLAGHVLDKYAAVNGDATVSRLS